MSVVKVKENKKDKPKKLVRNFKSKVTRKAKNSEVKTSNVATKRQKRENGKTSAKLKQSSKSPKAILKVGQTHLGRKGRHLSKPKLSGKSGKTIGTKCKVHHGTQRSSKSKIGSQKKVKSQQTGIPTKQRS